MRTLSSIVLAVLLLAPAFAVDPVFAPAQAAAPPIENPARHPDPGHSAAPPRPNILFILVDDLCHDKLGIAGNENIHTPVLDELARSGVYFTQATVHVPQCCPARALLISGLTPFQSGYLSMSIQEEGAGERDSFERFPTLPRILSEAGYHTALVGKWHIEPDPWRSGFKETRYWFAGGMCGYEDPLLSRGESRDEVVVPGNITEIFADDTIDFLRSQRAAQQPFFLWVSPTAPHEPCGPTPQRINDLYEGVTDADLVREGVEHGNSPRWDEMWVPYYQAVTHLDEQVGRILAALDETGLAGNTIVYFVSDGGLMMNRRGWGGKGVPFEDSIRIPVIVRAPWLEPRTSKAPISDLDLPPTILAGSGLADRIPTSWLGRDMTTLMQTGDDTGFDHAISLWASPKSIHRGRWTNRTIRTPKEKLIIWMSDEPDEYYDLQKDPHEEHNLFDSPEHAAARDELRRRLIEWMRAADDPALAWPPFKNE